MGEDNGGDAPQPLAGVRIVDFGGELSAYGTKLLAAFGADVVKVELPSGDPMRRKGPIKRGAAGPEASLSFAYYHTDKRGITLDFRRDDSIPVLERLARDADVVVISPSLRTPLAGFDDDALTLSWTPDDTIVASITPFGLTGPWRHRRATHLVSFAMGGSMNKIGPYEGPPVVIPARQHWDDAGAHFATCVLAALFNRPAVGAQLIDLSTHEVMALRDDMYEKFTQMGSIPNERGRPIGFPPTGIWPCADGPLDVAAHQRHHWGAFLKMLDNPGELSEESLEDPVLRRDIHDGLAEVISNITAPLSRQELVPKGQAAGLPCCMVYTPLEFSRDPQSIARELFVESEREGVGRISMVDHPVKYSAPLVRRRRNAPLLGEHNLEVYVGELGFTDGDLDGWIGAGLA